MGRDAEEAFTCSESPRLVKNIDQGAVVVGGEYETIQSRYVTASTDGQARLNSLTEYSSESSLLLADRESVRAFATLFPGSEKLQTGMTRETSNGFMYSAAAVYVDKLSMLSSNVGS